MKSKSDRKKRNDEKRAAKKLRFENGIKNMRKVLIDVYGISNPDHNIPAKTSLGNTHRHFQGSVGQVQNVFIKTMRIPLTREEKDTKKVKAKAEAKARGDDVYIKPNMYKSDKALYVKELAIRGYQVA